MLRFAAFPEIKSALNENFVVAFSFEPSRSLIEDETEAVRNSITNMKKMQLPYNKLWLHFLIIPMPLKLQ